jgi:phospholipid/cholesterol/gamma-HCH transport system substrate-binding protein
MSKRIRVQLRRYGLHFAMLVGLIVVGSAAGFYILLQQRLPNPLQTFYSVNGAFSSAAAVVPGLGEPVNVAGVHVGQITGTSAHDGLGVIHMEVDPGKLRTLYRNAHAVLVPNTPLDDMEVDITPGTPDAGVLADGATIPVSQTTAPIDSDELLDSLDADTRSWFTSLVTELNAGTQGRGTDIRDLLEAAAPTSVQLREIGDLLAGRRQELGTLVHDLAVVTKATSAKDVQLQTVVRAGDATVATLAGQDDALRRSIAQLPGTLQTTRATLTHITGLADALKPAATALTPTARRLPATLRDTQTLFQGAVLLPLGKIPAFVKAVEPLARQLPPLSRDFHVEIPALIDSFKVLTYTANEVAYDPGGKNPGFLYWLAWFAHNADSFISTSDANGPAWRSLLLVSCTSFRSSPLGPLLASLLGTTLGC